MIAFDLEVCPLGQSSQSREAWEFLSKLLVAHIMSESQSSHISLEEPQNRLSGEIKADDSKLATVCKIEDADTSYSSIIVWLLRSSGYMPDSTSVDRYSPAVTLYFYARADSFVAEFECIASMPDFPIPQVAFHLRSITKNGRS